MSDGLVRYVSDIEDSARWDRFVFREGDIVISTRSKSGTTWMQMICALLVFQTPDLPARCRRCPRGWTSQLYLSTRPSETSTANSTGDL